MSKMPPSDQELSYVGFSELQLLLIKGLTPDAAWDAYYLQLENLMSDSDDTVEF